MLTSCFYFTTLAFLSTTTTFLVLFFFFNDTATTEIYTLSLHDALPISAADVANQVERFRRETRLCAELSHPNIVRDRKSTRLNSSHTVISYAVFCLKKKKKKKKARKEN